MQLLSTRVSFRAICFAALVMFMHVSSTDAQPVERSLEEVASRWAQAIADAKDPELIASFFAEDGLAMYPAAGVFVGRQANEAAWKSYFSDRSEHPVTVDSVVVAASQDLGYVFGLHANARVDGGDTQGGRYVAVWQNYSGKWQLVLLSAHTHADIQPSSLNLSR